MTAYIILAIIPFVAFLCAMKDKKGRGLYALAAFFLFLLCLMGIRDFNVGIDISNYKEMFKIVYEKDLESIKTHYWLKNIEIGYVMFSKFFSTHISNDFRFFMFCVAVIAILPLFFLYADQSENSILSIGLFLSVAPFTMYFSGLRQILAMAFVVPAFYFTKKKWFIPFLFSVALALSFHESAIILILLYPIYHLKIPRKLLIVLASLFALTFIFREEIFQMAVRILGGKYKDFYGELVHTGAYTMFLLFLIFVVYSYVIPSERGSSTCCTEYALMIERYSGKIFGERKLSYDGEGLRNVTLLIATLMIFTSVSNIFMRVAFYFLPLVPIAIPKIAAARKEKYRWLTLLSEIVMIVFFYFWFLYNGATSAPTANLQVFPFVPFWKG